MHGGRKRAVVIPRVWYWGYVKMDRKSLWVREWIFVIYHGFRNKHIVINQYSEPPCPVLRVTAVYELHSSRDEYQRPLWFFSTTVFS